MTNLNNKKQSENPRAGWCPVYDTPCPQGSEAASSCEERVDGDYDPMNNLRDAAITVCAIQRAAEGYGIQEIGSDETQVTKKINQSFDTGENP